MADLVKSEIPEGLSCPICFEAPEAEVYQCDNEHWLCSKCYFQVTPPLCPECRSSLDRDRPRRCKAVERILDGLQLDCIFKSNGCDKKLSRGLIKGHQAECRFDFKKFGHFVNLCKSIGYPKCDFKFNNGNPADVVEHFVSKHGSILTTSEKFQIELKSFKESAKAGRNGFHYWTPMISDLKEWKCYLLTMMILNKPDVCFNWLSIFLPYPTSHRESSPVEIEYTVKTGGDLQFTAWSRRPIPLKIAHEMLPNQLAFVNNSLPFVKGCSKEGSLLIDCNIRPHGVAVPSGKEIQSFVCPSISVPVRFDRSGGNSAVRSFRQRLELDCHGDRSYLLRSMRCLFEGENPKNLSKEDVEWLKTDIIFVTAKNGSVEALKYLIKKEVNFNIVDQYGDTPLYFTLWYDLDKKIKLEMAKLLVDSGIADVHVLNDNKWSALHCAARYGNIEAVEYFLRKSCDVNAINLDGSTPLYVSIFHYNDEEVLKVAKCLLANGADLSIKNNGGQTALELATVQGKTKIAQFLRSQ